jgi:DNA invertase Pin-like site-specific DNA recombinase
VAYYRHSAQDRQENSIPLQREQVRQWADKNGIEVIREFSDHGKSGLSTENRDEFMEMMERWVKGPDDFEYVLVLDVSRWGRFQDTDLSASYSADCTRHGKQVVYTTLGFPRKDDPTYAIVVGLERYRAAQYSRELSDKVFKGLARIAQQGYHAGAKPPYGLHRLLLNEARKPVQILRSGEHKSIQNQRVTLTPGDKHKVEVVQRIFEECALGRKSVREIANGLNTDSIPSPSGGKWTPFNVRIVLANEAYIGTMIYNRSSSRLLSPPRRNPRDTWIRSPNAFAAIVSKELYDQAQAALRERQRLLSPENLLAHLDKTFRQTGMVDVRLLTASSEAPSLDAYYRRFRGVGAAFQLLHAEAVREVRQRVRDGLKEVARHIEDHADFHVLDGRLTVLVQPSVPVPSGYESYWPFRPDPRKVIDITLGVPLSGGSDWKIMGYLAFPRLFFRARAIRILGPNDHRIECFGHAGLGFLKGLLSNGGEHGEHSAALDEGPKI